VARITQQAGALSTRLATTDKGGALYSGWHFIDEGAGEGGEMVDGLFFCGMIVDGGVNFSILATLNGRY
jgi:hypothetical protein